MKTHALSGEWLGVRCKGQRKEESEAKAAAGSVTLVFGGVFVLYLLGHMYSYNKFCLDSMSM